MQFSQIHEPGQKNAPASAISADAGALLSLLGIYLLLSATIILLAL